MTAAASYSLTCSGTGGTASANANVGVTAASTASSNWTVLKSFDFSKDEGWAYTSGTISGNQAVFSKGQASFGTIDGKSLTLVGDRSGSTIRSAELRFRDLKIPSYFRAEVKAQVSPMVSGIWPAPVWFRPNGSGEGEIDVNEMYGKEPATNRYAHFTIHKTPYGADHAQVSKQLAMSQFGDPSAEGLHTYTVEKIPNKMTFYVDDKVAATFTPADASWWLSMYESGTQWYPIISLQIGPGSSTQVAGSVPTSWTKTTESIRSLTVWSQK